MNCIRSQRHPFNAVIIDVVLIVDVVVILIVAVVVILIVDVVVEQRT